MYSVKFENDVPNRGGNARFNWGNWGTVCLFVCVGQGSLWGFVVEIMDADLLFNCSVDEVSEAQILDEVVGLNYVVDNLFFGTTLAALDPHTRKESRDRLGPQIDIDVLNIITKKTPLRWSCKDFHRRTCPETCDHHHYPQGVFRGWSLLWCRIRWSAKELRAHVGRASC